MNYQEDVQRILNETANINDAAVAIYSGPDRLAIYVITIGLEALKSRKRRERRRELRTELQPQFKSGRTTGSVVFTEKTKKTLLKKTVNLFGDDGWQIGDLNLGDFSKEQLLAQAIAEENSAKGSLRNAKFYRALAEPLQPGQLARDYWKPETAYRIKGEIWKGSSEKRPDLV